MERNLLLFVFPAPAIIDNRGITTTLTGSAMAERPGLQPTVIKHGHAKVDHVNRDVPVSGRPRR